VPSSTPVRFSEIPSPFLGCRTAKPDKFPRRLELFTDQLG